MIERRRSARRWSTATATSSTPAKSPPSSADVQARRVRDRLVAATSTASCRDPVDTTRRAQDAGRARHARSTPFPTTSRCIRAWPRSTTTARKMAAGELPVDWGFAENLAYATLLDEGYQLRLVGQDCGRGTFFHRHAVLHDQNTDSYYLPLRAAGGQPEDVDHHRLAAQRGSGDGVRVRLLHRRPDDAGHLGRRSSAISPTARRSSSTSSSSSGEAKWGRLCGLALLLPHGYEGQGPEHSSARLERFLQLCALDNMLVCVPTTPAQMFHMIRRQMLHDHAQAADGDDAEVAAAPQAGGVARWTNWPTASSSTLIPDDRDATPKKVKRVVLCSGKVYYDLLEDAAQAQGQTTSRIVRIEQLYPFPRDAAGGRAQAATPSAKEVVWCQEEPQNQGAWYQIRHHLQRLPQRQAGAALRRPRAFALAGRRPFRRPRRRAAASWSPMRWSTRSAATYARRIESLRRSRSIHNPSTHSRPGRFPWPPKSKFRYCPNPFPTPPSPPGTRRPATRSSATRTCVDLETDKVVLEVPSPVDGVLKEIKFEEGATVTSQQVIAVIEEGAAAAAPAAPTSEEAAPAAGAQEVQPQGRGRHAERPRPPRQAGAGGYTTTCRRARASPPSRKASIRPRSKAPAASGAVTKEDIVNYASGKTRRHRAAARVRKSACR